MTEFISILDVTRFSPRAVRPLNRQEKSGGVCPQFRIDVQTLFFPFGINGVTKSHQRPGGEPNGTLVDKAKLTERALPPFFPFDTRNVHRHETEILHVHKGDHFSQLFFVERTTPMT